MGNRRTSWLSLTARGVYIVLPVLLVAFVAEILFTAVQDVIRPLMDSLPGVILRHRYLRFLATCFVAVVLLMLTGLLAQTRKGRSVGLWLESKVLNRVPFYSLVRSFASGLAGSHNEIALLPVLVTVDIPGLEQLGFIMERHANGNATVFLPSSPGVSSGTVVIVDPPRIRELDVSGRKLLMCLGRWGNGTAALLEQAVNDQEDLGHDRTQAKEGIRK